MEEAIRKASVLIEALPYVQRFAGRPVVIKFGGGAMESEAVLDDVLEDVVFLAAVGIRPFVVHGGGPQITQAMDRAGLTPRFVNGHRVTDAETLEVVVRVLADEINAQIIRCVERHGGRACSAFRDRRSALGSRKRIFRESVEGQERQYDLGFVGEVVRVDADALEGLAAGGRVVVIPPIGQDEGGQLYNVNADTAAAAVAGALQAEKVVFLSNVHGILADRNVPDSYLPTVGEAELEAMIASGTISGGMLPKVSACLAALKAGVRKAHIIDGRLPHSLLLEIFTDKGVGTQILHRPAS